MQLIVYLASSSYRCVIKAPSRRWLSWSHTTVSGRCQAAWHFPSHYHPCHSVRSMDYGAKQTRWYDTCEVGPVSESRGSSLPDTALNLQKSKWCILVLDNIAQKSSLYFTKVIRSFLSCKCLYNSGHYSKKKVWLKKKRLKENKKTPGTGYRH